ncbi:MAG TPA: hypothetical protein DDZ67_07065 [Xanthomonadaceae bacterium]|nr:hypothetical protein [Xanthomonadaceae bacterium]
MATISLALGGFGVIGNALQLLMAFALPSSADLAALLPPGTPLPPLLAWLGEHLVALSLAGIGGSALLAWISWALLQRREWARLAFIAGLGVVALANFAGLPLLDRAFDQLLPAMADPGINAELRAMAAAMRRALFWGGLAGAVAIAAVHGWIAWKLCRAEVRAEFRR